MTERETKLWAAAKAQWDDIYRFQYKQKWEDLPAEADLGMIDHRRLLYSHAESVFKSLGI